MTSLCLQKEEILAQKLKWFPFFYNKRLKGYWKWDIVQNACKKITKNVSFVENSDFIRESIEAAVYHLYREEEISEIFLCSLKTLNHFIK